MDAKEKRALATGAFFAAVKACDPAMLIRKSVSVHGGTLAVDGTAFPARRVYVVGMGKASGAMAQEFEGIVRVDAGVVAVPEGTSSRWDAKNIRLMESTHPFPSAKSVAAAKAMFALAKKARKGDLVVCLISGGGSSLVELPRKGISIAQLAEVSRLLMNAGAPIGELNCVRSCLSQVKCGGLAAAFGGATIVNLAISDVLGSPLQVIASGPTVEGKTDPAAAKSILTARGVSASPAGKAA
ncbi:MAG: glycerate-2-kinase family protein, partial [Candidatus Micrarchaeota archaeon]